MKTEYGTKPQGACRRHYFWHWQSVKEGPATIHQECQHCGWHRLLHYAGARAKKTWEDLHWISPDGTPAPSAGRPATAAPPFAVAA